MIFKQFIKIITLPRNLGLNKLISFRQTSIKPINTNNQDKNVQGIKIQKNSIMPRFEQGYAYGHHFPTNWSQQKIHKTLDPSMKQIQTVTFVKTKVGQISGKILIKFKNEKIRQKYIAKYNEDYIMTQTQSHRIVILPFQLKTERQKKEALEGLNLKYPVRISNLDFDVTKDQLLKLAADYGQVSHIQMYERQSGINRGFATVYFQKRTQSQQFIKFIDGLKYKQRKLKAYLIEKSHKNQQKQLLEVPIFTFKANMELMSKLKQRKYQLDLQKQ